MPLQPDPNGVSLNIPYDEEFTDLSLADIVGLFQMDLIPHLASEVPGSSRRLDKNGTDPHIHTGKPVGVLHELCNAFWRDETPSVPNMSEVFRSRALTNSPRNAEPPA